MPNRSESHTNVSAVCHNWWRQHIDLDTGYARACRAHLRRARSPIEALGIEATHDLNTKLAAIEKSLRNSPGRLAVIVVALAHVNAAVEDPVASSFGIKRGGDSRALSKVRFASLLKANMKELMVRLPRALSLIDGKANVPRLSSDLFYWGDSVRERWCFEYYGH